MQIRYLLIIASLLVTAAAAHAQDGQSGTENIWRGEEILGVPSGPADALQAGVEPDDEPRPATEAAKSRGTARETYLSAHEAAARAGREVDLEDWARASRQRVDAILKTLRGENQEDAQQQESASEATVSKPKASRLDLPQEPVRKDAAQSERQASEPDRKPQPEWEVYYRGFDAARSVRNEALARRQHRVHVFFDGRAVVLDGLVRRRADAPALLAFARNFDYPVVNRLSVFRPRQNAHRVSD